jgi:hypothetical protein
MTSVTHVIPSRGSKTPRGVVKKGLVVAVLASMALATIGAAVEDTKAMPLGWRSRKQILDIEDGSCHVHPIARAARAG